MITKPKRKPHQGDYDRERRHREKMLDDALKNTFPASDPLSIVLPPPTAADRDKVETSSWAALQFRKHRPALTASFLNSTGSELPTLINLRWIYAGAATNA